MRGGGGFLGVLEVGVVGGFGWVVSFWFSGFFVFAFLMLLEVGGFGCSVLQPIIDGVVVRGKRP